MIGLLTFCYLALFQMAAYPAIRRILHRKSSADCSVWREWLILVGVCVQFWAFYLAGADAIVLLSPAVSFCSVGTLLGVTYRFR